MGQYSGYGEQALHGVTKAVITEVQISVEKARKGKRSRMVKGPPDATCNGKLNKTLFCCQPSKGVTVLMSLSLGHMTGNSTLQPRSLQRKVAGVGSQDQARQLRYMLSKSQCGRKRLAILWFYADPAP